MGQRGAGGLVRSLLRSYGRAVQGVLLRDALDGGWGSVSSRLLSRHAAGFSGSARVRVCLFRWGVPALALRQPEERGQEGCPRLSAGRGQTATVVSLASA